MRSNEGADCRGGRALSTCTGAEMQVTIYLLPDDQRDGMQFTKDPSTYLDPYNCYRATLPQHHVVFTTLNNDLILDREPCCLHPPFQLVPLQQ